MTGTQVNLDALRRIADTLSGSAERARAVRLGDAPQADTATEPLSAAMSVLTDTLADLADACDGASAKVRQSHDSFAEDEHTNQSLFQQR